MSRGKWNGYSKLEMLKNGGSVKGCAKGREY